MMYVAGTLQSYGIPALLQIGVVADAENPGYNQDSLSLDPVLLL